MANINLTLGGTTGASETAARKQLLFANTVDFSGTHMVSGVSTPNTLLSTDIGQLLNIPAKFWMHTFGIRLDTVEGATATAVFGDGADPNGWLATAVDLDGTANDFFQSGKVLAEAAPNTFLDLYHPGKYYPTADTIDIDPANDLDTCVITVFAAGFILQ
jgi:hypothetical protein